MSTALPRASLKVSLTLNHKVTRRCGLQRRRMLGAASPVVGIVRHLWEPAGPRREGRAAGLLPGAACPGGLRGLARTAGRRREDAALRGRCPLRLAFSSLLSESSVPRLPVATVTAPGSLPSGVLSSEGPGTSCCGTCSDVGLRATQGSCSEECWWDLVMVKSCGCGP